MAKRQNFVVGSTNPNTQSRTTAQLNNAWNQFEVLRSGVLDGVFNAVSDYSNDSSNEIANAIVEITGSQPTGESQTELASALRQMREDIETTSLTFKGYISATQPSASDYDFQAGNIWIQSATLPTSFPVAIAGIWDGTQWESTTETYTQKDFDFFRNVNDNEGYYWFGGEWTVMSTDMSTTYFTLNQTSGKWEIKDSVNLPGAPTVATPTSASPQTQIANKKYVDENISAITSDFDLFDTKWRDATTNNTRWALSDGNWKTNAKAYNHLADDYDDVNALHLYEWHTADNTKFIYLKVDVSTDAESNEPVYNANGVQIGVLFGTTPTQVVYDGNFYNCEDSFGQDVKEAYEDTINGTTITYYQAADGHKIIMPAQETNANAIYTATGVAWYYILDTQNQQFKLPRVNSDKEILPTTAPVVSNGERPIYTDGNQSGGLTQGMKNLSGHTHYMYADGVSVGEWGAVALKVGSESGVKTDLSQAQGVYVGKKYLYFYVGLPAQV